MRLAVPLLLCLLLVTAARAEWIPIGPYGDQVQGLALDPNNPDVLHAVAYGYPRNALSFMSTDAGATWQPRGTFSLPDAYGLACDPHVPDLVYGCSRGVEFWRSTDAGLSWDFVVAPGPIRSVCPDPHVPGRLFAAGFLDPIDARPAAFVSTDYGVSWSAHRFDSLFGPMKVCRVDPQRAGVAWAGGDSTRLFRSTDAGLTWHDRSGGLPSGDAVSGLAINPANPDIVLAGMVSGMYRSTDAGGSWSRVAGPERVIAVEFGAADPGVAYALGRDSCELVYVSADTGVSWTVAGPDTAILKSHDLSVDPRDSDVAVVNSYRGVVRTTDRGATWRFANRGIRFSHCYTVGVNPGDGRNLFVGAHECRVFSTGDCGESWSLCDGFWCIENGRCCALAVAPEPGGDVVYAFEGYG